MVTGPEFEEGRTAVDAIKAAGIQVRLAFWAYFGDAEEWRLVIVTPSVTRGGPRSVYASIQKAFEKANVQVPLRLVVLAAPHDPLARLGMNAEALVRPFGGGQASLASGSVNVTVDPRYIYRDN